MDGGLFRKVALEKLSSPEQLDRLMRVTRPVGWLALASLGAIVAAVVVWGLLGTVEITVAGQGAIVPQGGVVQVAAPYNGTVRRVDVQTGDVVHRGQPLVHEELPSGSVRSVSSPFDGRVLDVRVAAGQDLGRGSDVLTLEPAGAPLDAMIYVPMRDGLQLSPGMPVRLSPVTVNAEQFGYLLGRVRSVASFPATTAEAQAALGNQALVRAMLAAGPVVSVRVALEPDARTSSGYGWSSATGPPGAIRGGTLTAATFVVARRTPVQLLLPYVAHA